MTSQVLERQLQAADKRWLTRFLHGPSRLRWEMLPPQVGDSAPDVVLPDSEGRQVRLSEEWVQAPLHLIFLRHYGCSCGKERAAQLNEEYARLTDSGARVVAIGQGEPERTVEYIRVRQMPCPVLCDTDYRAYDAYGVLEGTPATIFHDEEWKPNDERAGRKLTKSRRDTDMRVVDNPWLLPAEFVIDRQGIIRHAHRYQYCEDYPLTAVLVGAIRAAAG